MTGFVFALIAFSVFGAASLSLPCNPILFRTVGALFAAAVTWSVFMLVWNARRWLENRAMVFLGIAFLFVGAFDLLQVMADEGINVFNAAEPAIRATQLRIIARMWESVGLLAFGWLLGGSFRPGVVLACGAVLAGLLLATVLGWDIFPHCGTLVSPPNLCYQIAQAVFILLLLLAFVLIRRNRRYLDGSAYLPLVGAVLVAAVEKVVALSFDPFPVSASLMGQGLRLLFFLLIYVALIRAGLSRPHEALFRRMKEKASELERIRDRLDGISRNLPGIIFQLLRTPDGGFRFVHVSEGCQTLFGVSPDDALASARRIFAMIHPADREVVFYRFVASAVRRESFQAEIRVARPDGKTGWIQIGATPTLQADGAVLWNGVAVDITDRKEAEMDREHYLRLFRAVILQAPFAAHVIVGDAAGRLNLLIENDESKRLLGNAFAFREPIGTDAADAFPARFFDPDDDHPIPPAGTPGPRVFQGETITAEPYRVRDPDGTDHLILVNAYPVAGDDGRILAAVVIFREVIDKMRQTEAALRRSEEKYRSIFHNAPVGILHYDADTVITDCNDRFVEILGASRSALVGLKMRERLADRALLAAIERSLSEGEGFYEGVYWSVMAEKATPVRIFLRGIRTSDRAIDSDNGGRFIAGTGLVEDITEQHRAEAALRESEARFRNLFEHLDTIPVQGYDADRRVVYWNPASTAVYGYTPEEAMGLRLEALILPEEIRSDMVARISRWVDGGPPIPPSELVLRDKDGDPVPVYASHVIFTNARGEKEMYRVDVDLRRLHASEAERRLLAAAIEQAAEAIVITDAEGAIQYVNPAFEAVTGYTRSEAHGQNPRILKSDDHDEAFYREMWDTLTAGRVWRGRLVNRRKDGSRFTEEAAISPVRDHHGEVVGYVAVKHDITERLRLMREKADIENNYYQAQKMEAVGRLAAGVAHDMNNLLTPILGYGELLAQEFQGDPIHETPAQQILKAGMRARSLVRQLLAFGRKQALNIEPVSLNAIISEFETLLRRTIRENIELRVVLDRDISAIEADTGQIEQVIMNLAINAQDAMPEGGSLTIETGEVDLDKRYADGKPGVRPGRYVMMAVSDTGVGIPPEVQARIFDPFFTTKAKGKGTGMGLSTVYGIVKQHGGNVWVYSEPGMGAAFKLYFPAATCMAKPPTRDAPAQAMTKGTETVIVVEDDEMVRHIVTDLLRRQGYTPWEAGSAEACLDNIAAAGIAPSLLITDIVLPGMNGIALHAVLRRRFPGLRVLYMSGYTENRFETLRDNPKPPFIAKPFSVRTLAAKVREVLDADANPTFAA